MSTCRSRTSPTLCVQTPNRPDAYPCALSLALTGGPASHPQWDDATGEPIHTCHDVPRYCPDAKTLKNMKTMSIWAEGVEGDVQLFVQAVKGYGCATQ